MHNKRVLTCVYCGQEYPQETPAWGDKVLTDHIKVCPKHPIRKAEADIKILRTALVDMVGIDGKEELVAMKKDVEVLPISSALKVACMKGIDALLATLPRGECQDGTESI